MLLSNTNDKRYMYTLALLLDLTLSSFDGRVKVRNFGLMIRDRSYFRGAIIATR